MRNPAPLHRGAPDDIQLVGRLCTKCAPSMYHGWEITFAGLGEEIGAQAECPMGCGLLIRKLLGNARHQEMPISHMIVLVLSWTSKGFLLLV